jgi:hypothetical protein
MLSFDTTPDQPESFGYKVSWFAIKAESPAAVLDSLGIVDVTPANWKSGLAAMYTSRPKGDVWAFVSPSVGGWIFMLSPWLPYPSMETEHAIGQKFEALFYQLMQRFDDVQFLGSYRVVGFVAWARALKGKPVRVFSYADGDVMQNDGKQTPEEAQLGFADLSGFSPSDAGEEIFRIGEARDVEEDALVASGLSRSDARMKILQKSRDPIPDEADVVELAGLWCINPTGLPRQNDLPGLGFAFRLPQHLKQ